MSDIQANFFIKYKGVNPENDSEIGLRVLGESIIGFDRVVKDIFAITKINGDLKTGISQTREGSLIIDIILTIDPTMGMLIFDNQIDLLNFLKLVNLEMWKEANSFFDHIKNGHKTVNDYFIQHPVDLAGLSLLVSAFISIVMAKAVSQKQVPDFDVLPKEYAIPVHKMIKKGTFKKAIKPFVDEKITSIEVSSNRKFVSVDSVIINQDNFDGYLSESEKILPDYEDGRTYMFTGKIMALQATRGDSATFQVDGFPSNVRNMILYPIDGEETKDLEGYYKEQVRIKVILLRSSLYKKPKLKLLEIEKQNMPLNI